MNAEQAIRKAWARYPEAVIKFSTLSKGEKTPRAKSLPKNEMWVFVRHGKPQRVYVFKGALGVTVTYKKGNTIETSSEDDLKDLNVLPSADHKHRCTACGDFSMTMYISRKNRRLLCLDCFKAEK